MPVPRKRIKTTRPKTRVKVTTKAAVVRRDSVKKDSVRHDSVIPTRRVITDNGVTFKIKVVKKKKK